MIYDEIDYTDDQMLRRKAEEKLKQKQIAADKPEMETDVKKLLHELQVHQIELEMQNEELRHAYETSEAALKKHTMLYDFAPMSFFILNSDGSICDLNFTAAEMLGEKRFALLNTNFKLFVSDESKPVFNKFFKNVSNSNFKESCKVMLGYHNKPLSHVYIEGIATGDDQKCLLTVIDISHFKRENIF
jgi:PAS domain-containing protein